MLMCFQSVWQQGRDIHCFWARLCLRTNQRILAVSAWLVFSAAYLLFHILQHSDRVHDKTVEQQLTFDFGTLSPGIRPHDTLPYPDLIGMTDLTHTHKKAHTGQFTKVRNVYFFITFNSNVHWNCTFSPDIAAFWPANGLINRHVKNI